MIQDEIREMCDALLYAMEKPEGQWRVHVMVSAIQPCIQMVYINHILLKNNGSDLWTSEFGVHRDQWKEWSEKERDFFLRQKVTEAVEQILSEQEDCYADV